MKKFNVYGQLKKIKSTQIDIHENNKVKFFTQNPENQIHMIGISPNNYYKCEGKQGTFGKLNEMQYEEFKNHLTYLTGFKDQSELISSQGPIFFQELIKFTDGIIGPVISCKLYHDFRDNYDTAESYFSRLYNGELFWKHYQSWARALQIAKFSGAIHIGESQ